MDLRQEQGSGKVVKASNRAKSPWPRENDDGDDARITLFPQPTSGSSFYLPPYKVAPVARCTFQKRLLCSTHSILI